MLLVRSLLRAVLVGALSALALPVRAATDYTDLWWQPAEAGWGINLVQQANFVYATFFVYGQDGRATWFATQMNRDGSAERFTGPLFRVTGTWYGAPAWSGYQIGQAGTATFAATTSTTGRLSYTVDGVTVSRDIERQVLVALNVAGVYMGGVSGRRSGCTGGTLILDPIQLDILHSTATGSIRIDQLGTNGQLFCRAEGTAVQQGKVLTVENASYNCTDGWRSTARIFNLRPTPGGVEAQYFADAGGGCTETGQFSGVTQFP